MRRQRSEVDGGSNHGSSQHKAYSINNNDQINETKREDDDEWRVKKFVWYLQVYLGLKIEK